MCSAGRQRDGSMRVKACMRSRTASKDAVALVSKVGLDLVTIGDFANYGDK